MHRVSYHITIIGKITFLLPAEPEGQTRWVLAIALLTSHSSSALVSVAGRSASVFRAFLGLPDLQEPVRHDPAESSREPPHQASDNRRPNSHVPLALALRHRRQRHQMQEGR